MVKNHNKIEEEEKINSILYETEDNNTQQQQKH